MRTVVGSVLVACSLVAPVAVEAQGVSPELVRDLAPGITGVESVAGALVGLPAEGAERVVILAGRPTGSLWVTDGTTGGTRLLADLEAGEPRFTSDQFLDRVGDLVLVQSTKTGVWVTDGTRAGTRWLGLPSSASYLGTIGTEALFGIREPGVEAVEVHDLETGEIRVFSPPLPVSAGESLGDRLVFALFDGGEFVLAATDGTEDGTGIVARPGAGDSFDQISDFTEVGGRLFFFTGSDGETRLRVTDGTEAGTRALPVPGTIQRFGAPIADPGGFGVAVVTVVDGVAELWVSDGTAAGTRRLVTADGDPRFDPDTMPVWSGGRLYFIAADLGSGAEPWRFDPETERVERAADLCPGACSSEPRDLTAVDGGVFVSALAGEFGSRVPWIVRFDGTSRNLGRFPGPSPVGYRFVGRLPDGVVVSTYDEDGAGRLLVFPDRGGSGQLFGGVVVASEARRVGDRVVVPVADGSLRSGVLTTDGTLAGTGLLPGLGLEVPASSSPKDLTVAGSRLFFTAGENPFARRLWVSIGDGTGDATRPVPGLPDTSIERLLAGTADGELYFLDFPGTLRRTDGTAAGTVAFDGQITLDPGRRDVAWLLGDERGELVVLDGDDRLLATDRASLDLVALIEPTDGRILSVAPGAPGSGELYVATETEAFGSRSTIWVTDGTAAGTEALYETDLVDGLAWFQGALTYVATDAQGVTVRSVADPRSGVERRLASTGFLPGVARVFVTDSHLFYGLQGSEESLWATDGTPAGTRGLIRGTFLDGVLVGDRLALVVAQDTTNRGEALWWSDGTVAGTVRIDGFLPVFGDLAQISGRLLFTAATAATGAELWVSGGPETGARLVSDLAAGPGSSAPAGMVERGGEIFFAADDGSTGRELWRIATAVAFEPPVTPPDRAPLTSPQVPGFRFWVDITPQGQAPIAGSVEAACIPETLCVSGALAGRTEVFLRVIGPRPNGLLWPVITRFTPSRVEVWIEQVSTGDLRYYDLLATDPDGGELSGLFDREGFEP